MYTFFYNISLFYDGIYEDTCVAFHNLFLLAMLFLREYRNNTSPVETFGTNKNILMFNDRTS